MNLAVVLNRCDWCGGDAYYQRYHDHEWAVPVFDDRLLFEMLILEGAQAGLNWLTILRSVKVIDRLSIILIRIKSQLTMRKNFSS